MTNRIVSLQILRFVAATMVVYHHSTLLAKWLCGNAGFLGAAHFGEVGALGVDIFFVVSGFIITLTGPLATPRPNGEGFFWRRWGRVAPLFYVMTIPTLLAYSLRSPVNVFMGGPKLAVGQIVATVFFWPSFGPVNVPPILSNGWTLCFEMLFYLAVSLILVGGKVRRNIVIAAAITATFVLLRHVSKWIGFEILANPIFLEFGMGVLLALAWPRLQRMSPLVGVSLGWAGLVGFVCLALAPVFLIPGWDSIMRDSNVAWRVLLAGVPAALLVAGSLVIDRFVSGRSAEVLARLGDASYSIYLAHGLVVLCLYFAWRAFGSVAPWAVVLSAVTISVAVGTLTYRFVERPLLAFVRGRLPRGGVSLGHSLPESEPWQLPSSKVTPPTDTRAL